MLKLWMFFPISIPVFSGAAVLARVHQPWLPQDTDATLKPDIGEA
jgi:hypothetical protein